MVVLMQALAGIAYAHTTPAKGHWPVIQPNSEAREYIYPPADPAFVIDTNKTKRNHQNRINVLSPGSIKEIPRAKRQPKPEKIVTVNTTAPAPADTTSKKQRSKRRPEGMERPPDIIRRNNN